MPSLKRDEGEGEFDLSLYDYELPREMIAQRPAEPRDSARLLVLDRRTGAVRHAAFRDLPAFLDGGDLLVVNDTSVFPARTLGRRSTGGRVEVLFIRQVAPGKWEALVHCHGMPRSGEHLVLEDGRLGVRLIQRTRAGSWVVSLPRGTDLFRLLEEIGRVPLPPYIKREPNRQRDPQDRERYQTVYAREPGAVAAPTAGLHFTEGLMRTLEERGVGVERITLHVGVGTFKPIRVEDIRRHRMEREYYRIPESTVARIEETKAAGHRVACVGTTTCRALESAAGGGDLRAGEGWTDLYIRPPYRFRVVDALVTNFHLPRSTLLVMVSAFAGRERILAAYDVAKREGYRFYSYGDAMLII